MEDRDILALNKLLNHNSEQFGYGMDVLSHSISESLQIEVGVKGLGNFKYSGAEAMEFIKNPANILAKSLDVSERHLLSFYAANNDNLNQCQSLTKKGTRCSRSISSPINNIKSFLPSEVYMCSQHEEHGYLK